MRRPLRQFLLRLALAVPVAAYAAALAGIAPVSAQTATWVKYATVSPTTTLSAGSLCYSDGRDIACDGNLSNVTGGLLSDHITSGTAGVYVSSTGVINFRTGGVTTGYFDTAGVLVAPGISITSVYGISSTNGFFTGILGVSGSITTYGATSEIRLGNSYPRLAYWGASTAFPSLVFSGVGDGLRYSVAGAYMQLMAGGDVVANISRTLISLSPTLSVKGISVTDYGISSTTGYFSGNVGIGTGSPSSSLHIVGAVSNSAGGIILGAGTTPKYAYLYPAGNGSLNIETATTSGGFNFKHGGATSLQIAGAGGGPTTFKSYSLAVGGVTNASATLHVSGTIMMGSDLTTCDANRLGAIKYQGGSFSVCQDAANDWEPLVTGGISATLDRISSNSQAGVIANSSGYISFTTGGVTGTTYIDTAGRFTLPGISVTTAHGISSTNGYFSRGISVGTSVATNAVEVSGSVNVSNGNVILSQGAVSSYWIGAASGYNRFQPLDNGGRAGVVGSGSVFIQIDSDNNATDSAFTVAANANGLSGGAHLMSVGESGALSVLGSITSGYVGPSGYLTATPSASLQISGTARISSWTAVGANVTATTALDVYGTVSATAFVGDGSGLRNISASAISGLTSDRITSGTAGVFVSSTGVINFQTGGVTTGYFDTAGVLVAPGVSLTTGRGISSTTGAFSGIVGIGTMTPSTTAALTVNGDIFISPTGGVNRTISFGSGYGRANYLYDGPGGKWGWGLNGGEMQFFGSNSAGNHFSWNTAAAGGLQPIGTNELMRLVISTGNLGIGTVSPNTKLDVIGTVSSTGLQVTGDVSYTGVLTDTSDRRLKTRIAPLDGHAMEKLMLMKPVSFAMKDRPGLTEYGFIAQDVRGIFPELVFTAHDASKTMSMNYIGLIAPMVQGMQELKQENDALKARLEAQEDRLQRLERLVIDREAPVRH